MKWLSRRERKDEIEREREKAEERERDRLGVRGRDMGRKRAELGTMACWRRPPEKLQRERRETIGERDKRETPPFLLHLTGPRCPNPLIFFYG